MGKYFDIDDFLAEEEKLQVVLRNDVSSIGGIAAGSADENGEIKSGTKIDIPYWLAGDLFKRGFVNMKVPKAFAAQGPFKESLRADPQTISFKNHPYYYEIAAKLAKLPKLGLNDLAAVIERAWGMRWGLLLNHSYSLQAANTATPLFSHTFSQTEYEIYQTAFASASMFSHWKLYGSDKPVPYKPIGNPKKRKRDIAGLNVKHFLTASNIAHESKIINLATAEQKTDEFKLINPHQKVPALVDGDVHVYESLAIIRYLAFKYSSPLLPYHEGPEAVATIDRDAEFIYHGFAKTMHLLVFEKLFKTKFGGEYDLAAIEKLEGELKTQLHQANEQFFSDCRYVIGNSFSLADVFFTVALSQGAVAGINISEYPKIVQYYEFAKTQPAFEEAHIEFNNLLLQYAKSNE